MGLKTPRGYNLVEKFDSLAHRSLAGRGTMWDFTGYAYQNQEYLSQNRQGTLPFEQKQALDPGEPRVGSFIKKGAAWKKLSIPIWLWLFGTLGLWSLNVPDGFPLAFLGLGAVSIAGLFLWFYGTYRRRSQLIRDELKMGRVVSGTGEILFRRGSYQAVLDGQQLVLGGAGKGDLSPGVQYRFFYLPESRVLLSAEALGPVPEKQAVKGLTEVLAEVNGFDLDSLPENRQGILTGSQLDAFIQPVLIGLFAVGFPAGVILYGLYAETGFLRPLREGAGPGRVLDGLNTVTWVIGLVLLGLSLFGVYYLVTTGLDFLNREVVYLEGTGLRQRKLERDTDGSTRELYYYLVGGREFKVSEDAYQAFENGRRYRVYFTPRRKRMVNIEVLD